MRMYHKTLAEICSEIDVTRRAVQGYEKAGLVSAVGKNKYGYLLYDQAAIERIRMIRFFQKTGLSIKEIQGIIDASANRKKAVLRLQIEKLEARSREISDLIDKIEQYMSQL